MPRKCWVYRMRGKRRPAGRALPDAVGGASHRPSRQMLSRWIRETWREGTATETPAWPPHINVSSSWATAESGESISRGKKGVLSACQHEILHVGSKNMSLWQTLPCWLQEFCFLPGITPGLLFLQWAGKVWNRNNHLTKENVKLQKRNHAQYSAFWHRMHNYVYIE